MVSCATTCTEARPSFSSVLINVRFLRGLADPGEVDHQGAQ